MREVKIVKRKSRWYRFWFRDDMSLVVSIPCRITEANGQPMITLPGAHQCVKYGEDFEIQLPVLLA